MGNAIGPEDLADVDPIQLDRRALMPQHGVARGPIGAGRAPDGGARVLEERDLLARGSGRYGAFHEVQSARRNGILEPRLRLRDEAWIGLDRHDVESQLQIEIRILSPVMPDVVDSLRTRGHAVSVVQGWEGLSCAAI